MNREPITLRHHLVREQRRAGCLPELSLPLERVAFAWTALAVGTFLVLLIIYAMVFAYR